MRTHTVLLVAMLTATMALPGSADAQLSPQGLLNGMTRPIRSIFGRLGHFPHHYRHREAAAEPGRQSTESQQPDGRLGRVGPAAWPTAYEDVIGFAFWPDEYAPRLRGHGFDVIADTVTGRIEAPRRPAQVATTGAAVGEGDAAGTACASATGDGATWPSSRLSQTIQLTDAQHDAADAMQKAVNQSAAAITANCSDPTAQTAPDRLGALVQTLWSVRDSGQALRASIKDFDATLTQAQKASFVTQTPQAPQPDARNQGPANQNPAMNKMYQACAQPNVEEAERFVKQIEMRVRPTKEQAARLENLHKVSFDMAKLLMASCAKPVPADPVARLDAAGDQLTAMNYAATTVQLAFNDFYAALNDRQKAMFDQVGR